MSASVAGSGQPAAARAAAPSPAPVAASTRPLVSSTSSAPPSTSVTAAATSSTPPPRSTSVGHPVVRGGGPLHRLAVRPDSWLAVASSSSAARVSCSSRALSMATAACAASDASSVTSSRANGRSLRLAANSTPITVEPSRSGTPRMAIEPLLADRPRRSRAVCWNRASAG